jgi:hypothetical protein
MMNIHILRITIVDVTVDEAIRCLSPGVERVSIVVLTELKGGHFSLAEDASFRFIGKVKVP